MFAERIAQTFYARSNEWGEIGLATELRHLLILNPDKV